jgi:hypothetical protein
MIDKERGFLAQNSIFFFFGIKQETEVNHVAHPKS